jgi:prolyl oligopeptidase
MDSGGILVVAAVRGGSERGRDWHRAATGASKPRSFQDLRDVTAELIARGLCPPGGPVLYGQSNGGLTVAATFMKWPHLFAGLVVENALLDMVYYEQLDPDSAWRHEFGTATKATSRLALASYSPVDAVRSDASYPPILIVVGAADQTVNPLHSYRFAARLAELSPATPTHLLVTPDAHGLSTPPSQLSAELAVILCFADRALAQGRTRAGRV